MDMSRLIVGVRTMLVVLAVLAGSGKVWAQANGSIVGTVTDSAGAAIPSATVTVLNAGTGETKTAKSGGTGDYQFLRLLPGFYKITVEGAGFKQFV